MPTRNLTGREEWDWERFLQPYDLDNFSVRLPDHRGWYLESAVAPSTDTYSGDTSTTITITGAPLTTSPTLTLPSAPVVPGNATGSITTEQLREAVRRMQEHLDASIFLNIPPPPTPAPPPTLDLHGMSPEDAMRLLQPLVDAERRAREAETPAVTLGGRRKIRL